VNSPPWIQTMPFLTRFNPSRNAEHTSEKAVGD